jgi:hypothetical protein
MTAALVIGLVVLALAAAIAAAVTRPVNLTLTIADGTLVVEPRGADVLMAMRRRIEVPLGQVTDVRVMSLADAPRAVVRVPSTFLPGVIVAGSYGVGDERTFWDVRRGDPVLVIRCAIGAPYRALVLEFAEPDAVRTRIRGALAG